MWSRVLRRPIVFLRVRGSILIFFIKKTFVLAFVRCSIPQRIITQFNFVDSTALINLGDPSKRALMFTPDHCVSSYREETERSLHEWKECPYIDKIRDVMAQFLTQYDQGRWCPQHPVLLVAPVYWIQRNVLSLAARIHSELPRVRTDTTGTSFP